MPLFPNVHIETLKPCPPSTDSERLEMARPYNEKSPRRGFMKMNIAVQALLGLICNIV